SLALVSSEREGLAATGQRNTAFDATLLTFCPPGPELRTNENRISRRGIAICALTRTIGENVMQQYAEPSPAPNLRTQRAIVPRGSNNRTFRYPVPSASRHMRRYSRQPAM